MTRDPRIYPKAGDVLRSPHVHEPREEYVDELIVARVTNEWVLFSHGVGVPIGCWELWCKKLEYEVLKVAA
jgi:hypothetical protein